MIGGVDGDHNRKHSQIRSTDRAERSSMRRELLLRSLGQGRQCVRLRFGPESSHDSSTLKRAVA
jgi:hypothetical protein